MKDISMLRLAFAMIVFSYCGNVLHDVMGTLIERTLPANVATSCACGASCQCDANCCCKVAK